MRVEFGIGIGVDQHERPIDKARVLSLIDTAREIVSWKFGGCFVIRGSGAWIGPDDELIVEPGIVIQVDIADELESEVTPMAEQLARLFNQTAVHVAVTPVTGFTVGHPGGGGMSNGR